MNIFKKLARRIVVAEAGRLYNKAVRLAEKQHEICGERIYVITDPANLNRLITVNDEGFKKIRKDVLHGSGKTYPLKDLKRFCWYYTRNHNERDPLPPNLLMGRKMGFVHECMNRAGVLEKQK